MSKQKDETFGDFVAFSSDGLDSAIVRVGTYVLSIGIGVLGSDAPPSRFPAQSRSLTQYHGGKGVGESQMASRMALQ